MKDSKCCSLCETYPYSVKSRLVQDSCGHLKCRTCLIKEENGCSICDKDFISTLNEDLNILDYNRQKLNTFNPDIYETVEIEYEEQKEEIKDIQEGKNNLHLMLQLIDHSYCQFENEWNRKINNDQNCDKIVKENLCQSKSLESENRKLRFLDSPGNFLKVKSPEEVNHHSFAEDIVDKILMNNRLKIAITNYRKNINFLRNSTDNDHQYTTKKLTEEMNNLEQNHDEVFRMDMDFQTEEIVCDDNNSDIDNSEINQSNNEKKIQKTRKTQDKIVKNRMDNPVAKEPEKSQVLKVDSHNFMKDHSYKKSESQKYDWNKIIIKFGSPAKFKCKVCDKLLKSQFQRDYHIKCLTGENPFKCSICDKTFVKSSHYEYHQRMHNNIKPFKCDMCGACFVQKNKLNRHMATHKQNKDIVCDVCGKEFNRAESLKIHSKIHSSVREFRCEICEKAFTSAGTLKTHQRTHKVDKPFKCKICSSSFKVESMLKRHMITHEKKRPFTCDKCKRTFRQKDLLRRHILSTHSGLKYSCQYCHLEFQRRDNLSRHVKHYHPNGKVEDPLSVNDRSVKKPVIPNPVKPKKVPKVPAKKFKKNLPENNLILEKPKVAKNFKAIEKGKNLLDPIPLEEVVGLNKQIEESVYSQNSAKFNFFYSNRSKLLQDHAEENESGEVKMHWRRRTAEVLKKKIEDL